jgi:hypothetical protein
VAYIHLHVHGGVGRFCGADIQAPATVNSGVFDFVRAESGVSYGERYQYYGLLG